MRKPLEITYRNVSKSESIETLIREKAAKLERLHDSIIGCRVSVEKPQEYQKSGNKYRVRIDLRVPPGKELVTRRESGQGKMHEGLHKVINDAFHSMERQVKKIKGKQENHTKSQEPAGDEKEAGIVVRLFPEEGYGFIKTVDGQEVYFHRNSVIHEDFDRLQIGTGVRIVQTDGDKGPQASTVQIVDKPGSRVSQKEEADLEVPVGWEP
ncbi:MAG TPA: HPF/RaiA family ribosome-associated protein, partial [Desulfosalsimonadaceae bacterium]|nr:HPF/RaiA family ribosome-associated protein [Desulfosalsimonadaceae bacterium]